MVLLEISCALFVVMLILYIGIGRGVRRECDAKTGWALSAGYFTMECPSCKKPMFLFDLDHACKLIADAWRLRRLFAPFTSLDKWLLGICEEDPKFHEVALGRVLSMVRKHLRGIKPSGKKANNGDDDRQYPKGPGPDWSNIH